MCRCFATVSCWAPITRPSRNLAQFGRSKSYLCVLRVLLFKETWAVQRNSGSAEWEIHLDSDAGGDTDPGAEGFVRSVAPPIAWWLLRVFCGDRAQPARESDRLCCISVLAPGVFVDGVILIDSGAQRIQVSCIP